jgi:phage head maturation protease
VRGLSIGFIPIKAVPVDADKPWKGMHYKEWEMFELSAVTIPANAECSILSVKNFDLAAAVADGSNTVQPDANTSIQRAKAAILAAKRATRR